MLCHLSNIVGHYLYYLFIIQECCFKILITFGSFRHSVLKGQLISYTNFLCFTRRSLSKILYYFHVQKLSNTSNIKETHFVEYFHFRCVQHRSTNYYLTTKLSTYANHYRQLLNLNKCLMLKRQYTPKKLEMHSLLATKDLTATGGP